LLPHVAAKFIIYEINREELHSLRTNKLELKTVFHWSVIWFALWFAFWLIYSDSSPLGYVYTHPKVI